MTATSALEKIDGLIEVATQRLIPQALQRLTVKEILGEHVLRKVTLLGVPAKEDLGITAETEVTYNRLVKFLRLHEPTGHEKDVTHKYDVVRFLNLKQMLHECQQAKLPQVQAACLDKVVHWFDASCPTAGTTRSAVLGSASAPVLPPRMSPKKVSTTTPKAELSMVKPSSDDALALGGSGDVMMKAAMAHKLEKYKMPDLRASHIRRVAQLRSRGEDVPEEDLEIAEVGGTDDGADDCGEILEPSDYERRNHRERIKATFHSYEPQTEAEFAMNQVWLERKRLEDQEKEKAQEVRGKLHSWSMSKSRDESEYLRKREAMQLAAGLDKLVDDQLEAINQPRRHHLEKKKQEWQALQLTVPPSVTDRPDYASGQRGANDRKAGESAHVSSATALHSAKKTKTGSGGAGTPTGSGGMHFRNHLPANYTPQSKRSNGTPTSFSSKDDGSTPNTPLSTSSSGKLWMLDEAAARVENRAVGRAGYYASPVGNNGSPAVHDHEDERLEASTLQTSDRAQENRPQLRFEPFHTTTLSNQGALPIPRTVSAATLNRKLYPRGTIPPQAEPVDPEYRHLHAAALNRKPPMPTTIVPDKSLVGNMRNGSTLRATTAGNNQRESTRVSSVAAASKLPPSSAFQEAKSSLPISDFRNEQMQEVDRIRILFEQYKLTIPIAVIERGLLVPEDRSTIECVQNLPLPGSRLVPNPLLQVRVKAKTSKKKKKTKGSKGGAKKTKGKATAGDRSKSPTKKNKK